MYYTIVKGGTLSKDGPVIVQDLHKGPNKLINATGGGPPSLIFVCPQ